jgi:hypothetical protein
MTRPKHTKPDANQNAITRDLQKMGFEVIPVHNLGGDALDLFVLGYQRQRRRWEWLQVEVKTETTSRFTKGEKEYFTAHGIDNPFTVSEFPILAATSAEEIAGWFWAVQR